MILGLRWEATSLFCALDYRRQAMFIKFVGTHAEYDAVDVVE